MKTVVDNIVFSSKKEAARYSQLKLLEKQGTIKGLVLQPKFVFEQNGVRICSYIADFAYIEKEKAIVEDCKGFKTPVYKLKRKLMKAFFGIIILES